ncbi:MAG: hypothetical protein HKN09_08875 [Saprospiraceae bacterium]|nr:hypothetical protein [Saprospiraceae bacterium]
MTQKQKKVIKIVIILTLIAGSIYALTRVSDSVKSMLNKLNPFKTETTVDQTGIAIEALNEIGEIVTAQYYGETYCSDGKKPHKEEIVYLGRGVVTSGINLKSIEHSHFEFNNTTRTIRLDSVSIEILDSIINPWFIPGKLEGFQLFRSGKKYEKFKIIQDVKMACISNLKSDAMRMDIKLHALKNAEETLGHLVSLITKDKYKHVVLSHQSYFDLKYGALNTDGVVDEFEFGGLIDFLEYWSSEFDQYRYTTMDEQLSSLKAFCSKIDKLDYVIDTNSEPVIARQEKARIDALIKQIMGAKYIGSHAANPVDTIKSKSNIQKKPKENKVYGIDISKFQSNEIEDIDLGNVNFGFIICKATEGVTYTDSMFNENWKALSSEELVRGAYHFYRTQDRPKKQVDHYLKTIGALNDKDFPPIIDFEEKSIDGTVNKIKVQKDLLKCFELLENKSRRTPILYTDLNIANTYLTDAKWADYPIWIAVYRNTEAPELPKVWQGQNWTLWQKSDSYSMDNIKNDLDVFNGDFEQLKAFVQSTHK